MIEYLVLGGAALGAVGWERLRRRRHAKQHAAFLALLSDETQVVLHVANHEATQRQQHLAPMHLVYGLVQDEAFVAAVKQLGGDPDAIEERVLAEMDRGGMEPYGVDVPEAVMVIAHAAAIAQQRERTATLADLFGRLIRTHGAEYFAAAPLTPHGLLFLLVHGEVVPRSTIANARDVFVVLRDDDNTTRDFVVRVLREVFELPAADAERVMQQTHETGRTTVGRYPSEIASARIDAVRARARDAGFPLWIGVEPV